MIRHISSTVRIYRNGGFRGFLQAKHDSAPTITMDDGSDIKMVFTGDFEPDAYDADGKIIEFDPLIDELEPVLVINKTSHILGKFLPVSVAPDEKETGLSLSIEAYDRCWLVKTTTGTARVFFPVGMRYLDAIQRLLTAAGIMMVKASENDAVFEEDREDWELGTNYLEIVNQLLGEINFKPLWFDTSGAAVLEPVNYLAVLTAKHTLDTTNVKSLIYPGLSRKTDIYSTPNVFVCICDNPDKELPMVAVAKNVNDNSPLSVSRRGREIVQVERVNNIANQEQLEIYANQLLFLSLMSGEEIKIKTGLHFGWGVGDVVGLRYKDLTALCISHRWTMELKAGGKMDHTLERIIYNYESMIADVGKYQLCLCFDEPVSYGPIKVEGKPESFTITSYGSYVIIDPEIASKIRRVAYAVRLPKNSSSPVNGWSMYLSTIDNTAIDTSKIFQYHYVAYNNEILMTSEKDCDLHRHRMLGTAKIKNNRTYYEMEGHYDPRDIYTTNIIAFNGARVFVGDTDHSSDIEQQAIDYVTGA